jgi:hypothetical protein
MIYECKVFCHATSESEPDDLFSKDSNLGKWLPFAFDLSLVDAVKLSSDSIEDLTYKCSTVFLQGGDAYIIDTKFRDFLATWKEYKNDIEIPGDDDLEL